MVPRNQFPGSNIPGILTTRTSIGMANADFFWDIHDPAAALVISLADESYNELVLEVEDPEALIRDINRRRKRIDPRAAKRDAFNECFQCQTAPRCVDYSRGLARIHL